MVELSSRPPRTQVGNGGINSSSKCIREGSFVRFPNFQFLMRPPFPFPPSFPPLSAFFPRQIGFARRRDVPLGTRVRCGMMPS